MFKKINTSTAFFVLIIFSNIACAQSNVLQSNLINTSHLDFLYEEIKVEDKQMGVIHIYSNYPDYKWIGDDDEGIACVDDAARAAVFYLKYYQFKNDSASLRKAKNLLRFVLFMQAENGFFYNFIWDDHSINKTFKTSVAEPNWWSWRAMWALTEGYNFFKNSDIEFSKVILNSINKTALAVKTIIPKSYDKKNVDGFERPAWLPYEFASDQSAILLLSLVPYYQMTNDEAIKKYCEKLIEGILLMQEGDENSFPYCAFLSWENLWHGWGNLQSFALLNSYKIFNEDSIKQSALNEIKYFYQFLVDKNYLSEFTIQKNNNDVKPKELKKFSQIAYIIRPMIYASLKAFEITNDSAYAVKAAEIASWFFGKNPANEHMYFPETGICFDGINSEKELNKNSGAESTIEALLAILEIEKNSIAKDGLENFMFDKMETNSLK